MYKRQEFTLLTALDRRLTDDKLNEIRATATATEQRTNALDRLTGLYSFDDGEIQVDSETIRDSIFQERADNPGVIGPIESAFRTIWGNDVIDNALLQQPDVIVTPGTTEVAGQFNAEAIRDAILQERADNPGTIAVSYTHLTLPTNREV